MSQKTYMYDAQWQALLSAIGQGDTTALVTALNSIARALQNQQITLDFSNLNSDTVLNSSNVTGDNVSNALDTLFNNDDTQLSKKYYSPMYATSNDYGRHITNAFFINIDNRLGIENTGGYSTSSDSNVPSDMLYGIRDVVWYNSDIIFVRYFGYSTSNEYAYWCNMFSRTSYVWKGWKKLAFK